MTDEAGGRANADAGGFGIGCDGLAMRYCTRAMIIRQMALKSVMTPTQPIVERTSGEKR